MIKTKLDKKKLSGPKSIKDRGMILDYIVNAYQCDADEETCYSALLCDDTGTRFYLADAEEGESDVILQCEPVRVSLMDALQWYVDIAARWESSGGNISCLVNAAVSELERRQSRRAKRTLRASA